MKNHKPYRIFIQSPDGTLVQLRRPHENDSTFMAPGYRVACLKAIAALGWNRKRYDAVHMTYAFMKLITNNLQDERS